jgi:hypothetical protein
VVEARSDKAEEFGFGKAHAVGVGVFVKQARVEHGRVVGGKDDGDAVAEQPWKRMVGEGNGLTI